MKILYVTALNETINAFLVPHILKLVDDGNIVECACKINRNIDDRLSSKCIKHYNIEFSRNPLNINYHKVINEIRQIQIKNNYDIVHVHTPIAAFLTRFALRNFKVKIIYTAHGFHFFKGSPVKNWILYFQLEKLAAKWTDRLVTINEEDYSIASKFNLRKNGEVFFMHGVGIDSKDYEMEKFDHVSYRESLGLKKDDFIILVIADLNKNKNHIQLLKAVKILNNIYPKLKVICAGDGPLKNKLIKKVKEFNLENNVIFLGFRSDIKELINISNIIGLFSKREGLPKCLMESLVCGKPILVNNIRGSRDFVINNEIGEIVEVDDFIETAKKIEYMMKKDYNPVNIRKSIEKYNINYVLEEVKKINKFY